jgi:hypothetical protein
MDSIYISTSPGQNRFFPTEMQKSGCVMEKNNKMMHDPRYVQSGLHTTAYRLRFDSNVDQHMNALPHYYTFGPSPRELDTY